MGKSVSVGDTLPHTDRSSLLQIPDRTEQVLTRAGGRVGVVASLSQGRIAAAQCGLFTHESVPVIFEPPCSIPLLLAVHTGHLQNIKVKFYYSRGLRLTSRITAQ